MLEHEGSVGETAGRSSIFSLSPFRSQHYCRGIMYVRYCGNYLVTDLENLRLSVSKVSTFNDPFELHLMPGENVTPLDARIMIDRMLQARLPFVIRLLGRFPNVRDLTFEGLPPEARTLLITNYLSQQRNLIAKLRANFVATYEKHTRVMCLCRWKMDKPLEIPMWAYYAVGHTGIRLHLSPELVHQKGCDLKDIIYHDTPPKQI